MKSRLTSNLEAGIFGSLLHFFIFKVPISSQEFFFSGGSAVLTFRINHYLYADENRCNHTACSEYTFCG